MDNRPIGLFDSGVGGLSIYKKVHQLLPDEATVFIGDNAHMPYGDRSTQEIIEYTKQCVDFLLQKDIKLLILACNTATAVVLPILKKELSIPVIGVIPSGAVAGKEASDSGKICVIATSATINSHAYEQSLSGLQVTELATPLLAPLVENEQDPAVIKATVQKSLDALKDTDFDTLILGCTHYPLIEKYFHELYPDKNIIDPADQVAKSCQELLAENSLLGHGQTHDFYTTGQAEHFESLAKTFLGEAITAKEVTLGD